ncbi:MAG: hypothetical protein CL535_21300 [Ahrensia sp.]|nr:hypothetical protein [Ahrensia sp.]
MNRFNNHRSSENHLFIVTSLVPAALFLVTLIAAVHVSRSESLQTEAGIPGYAISVNVTA